MTYKEIDNALNTVYYDVTNNEGPRRKGTTDEELAAITMVGKDEFEVGGENEKSKRCVHTMVHVALMLG